MSKPFLHNPVSHSQERNQRRSPGAADALMLSKDMTSAQERKIRQTGCDARFDKLTRQLYSTDASIYQIHPIGAAFPKTAEQASLVIHATADAGLSITPRGAGTSLVGNAIGDGLIVDFLRYNRQITDLDLEKRSVRVGAGVVLDQLNEFLKPHGFCF